MSVLNREQLSNTIRNFLGDNVSESAVKLTEDVMDTFDDLNNKVNSNEEMVPKSELDRTNEEWAKKYRDRFFDPLTVENKNDKEKDDEPEKPKKLTYENLFKME